MSELAGSWDPNNVADRHDAGAAAEAVHSAWVNDVLGGETIYQHAPGEPSQGLDQAYLLDGQLHAAETKSIISEIWHQPQTSLTVDGRQMDDEWVADRLGRIGIDAEPGQVGKADDQVSTNLAQVDFIGDTFAVYEVSPDGMRAENAPSEIWSLTDIIDAHDGANPPDFETSTDNAENLDSEASENE